MATPTTEPQELAPFTADQARALSECRFVTRFSSGGPMLAITNDKAIADAVGVSTIAYRPDPRFSASSWEYELRSWHPAAIEAAGRIMAERRHAA